ncbi:sporulation initiation factor Spo0A C-terminal domain-containing protein [Hominifimenecus sp. rT4P-3]|uniref:sporulation initiation factor Spo0A C-terminal domain-containing protein n=1 Tax=Hominifimenecus sp. rT4P-3 TaxID=3242979 RepID=UPI003DA5BB83
MKESIETLIYWIAGRPTRVGYRYLTAAIEIVLEDGYPIRSLTTSLYPKIAERTGATTHSVARGLARAVDDCWEYGNRNALEQLVGRRLLEKPSPGEMIYYLVRYLSH